MLKTCGKQVAGIGAKCSRSARDQDSGEGSATNTLVTAVRRRRKRALTHLLLLQLAANFSPLVS